MRQQPQTTDQLGTSRGRPVLLATLDVPFDHNAVVYAVDSAVELGQRLIVANFVEQEPLPLSATLGYDDLPYTHEMAESLAEPVRLALSLGVKVARLRVKSFRPIQAMVEVVAEENAGLLVFGPDRTRIRRLRYRRAARAIRARVTTLIWMAD
ncbi:MAG TPA: universal stress protein [Streptosporangiaceae bacterium]|nr:universal stress protein [Streptosporangiaceae bacterium]